MKYKISWLEQKTTSTGKVKADATLVDDKGIETDKVTIWADFPGFADLKPESTVEGDVVVKQNGKFTNKTLYAAKTDTLSKPAYTRTASGVAKAMETKNQNITAAQERKDESIKVSSTFRDATIITVEFFNSHGKTYSEDEFKTKWQEVRNWLWNQFDTAEDKQNQPF